MSSALIFVLVVAGLTGPVAVLSRRRMHYERTRWIVLQAMRPFIAATHAFAALGVAYLEIVPQAQAFTDAMNSVRDTAATIGQGTQRLIELNDALRRGAPK